MARRTPKAWEGQLAHWHRGYRKGGPFVVQCGPVVKVLNKRRGDGSFVGVFDREGPLDFMGSLPDGRVVGFDAKVALHGKAWSHANLKAHQARQLDSIATRGGLAFLALHAFDADWFVPWDTFGDRWWDAPKGRMTAQNIETWAVPMREDGWWPLPTR